MTPEEFRLLYDYNSWANHRMLDACEALTPEQFTREMGSSFSSVRDTLAHIYGAEWLWLERWKSNTPTKLPASADFPTLSSVRVRWVELDRDLNGFIASLSASDLPRAHAIRNTQGKEFVNSMQEMLQHLANHSTYHRGQVTTLLRQLGAKAPYTDLIAFYRERRASAAS